MEVIMVFIPTSWAGHIPSCDLVELMSKPKIRELSYKVNESFPIPHFNTHANVEDTIYKNVGDKSFFLEKKLSGMTYHCEVEDDIAINAMKFGWIELEKVEEAE